MRLKKYILVSCLVSATFGAVAQDIHYSQFYNSPLTLNPALTGKINGTFRIGAIYRNQWFGRSGGPGGATYSTPSASFDMPIRLKSGDAVGVGGYILNDQSKGGAYSRIQVELSAAYHKALGSNKNHSLSFGVQVGFLQRMLDKSKLVFGDQLDNTFDQITTPNPTSTESLSGNTSNFDVNTGVVWNGRITPKANLFAGISGYNLIQPLKVFNNIAGTGNSDNQRRLSATAGADVRITNRFSLLPSLIYMREAKAQETNLGLAGAIDINRDFILTIGAYYRVKDAFIAYIGGDYKGFRLGFSYDATATSSFNGITPGKANGSFELSLMYVGRYIPLPQVKPSLYCPRF